MRKFAAWVVLCFACVFALGPAAVALAFGTPPVGPSAPGTAASYTTPGTSTADKFVATGAVNSLEVPTNGELCLDGSACTWKLVYNGTAMILTGPSSTQLSISNPADLNMPLRVRAIGAASQLLLYDTTNSKEIEIRNDNDRLDVYNHGNSLMFGCNSSGSCSWPGVQSFETIGSYFGAIQVTGRWANDAQSVTCADTGDGNPCTVTITPTTPWVQITCNDAHTCDVTMGEDSVAVGEEVCLVNISAANVVDFADTANVSELAGAFAAGTQDTICMKYAVDRWVETNRSNN